MSLEQKKVLVEKFVDAVNRHYIDIANMVAEADQVAVIMATSGYHTGIWSPSDWEVADELRFRLCP